MKIVHVLHAFPPDSRAGSENYVEALARAQAERNEVSVFHRVVRPEWPEYDVRESRLGALRLFQLNRTFADMRSFEETYRSEPVARAFGAFLDSQRPDVVHFHHATCLSTTCVDEAKQRGIPVAFTLHDFWLLCPRGQLLRRDLSLCTSHGDGDCVRCMAAQLRIRGGHPRALALWRRAQRLARFRLPAALHRRVASRPFAREEEAVDEIRARERAVRAMCDQVDVFVSPSHFLKERFVEFGIPASRIRVSDNGFVARKPPPASRAAGSGPLRVVYIGTWIPSKGVHLLIEAFAGLDPEHAQLELHGYAVPFDGFDDYGGHLARLARGLPHVELRSRYEPEDVPQILADADVVVVPSLWYENSPLTIHEALLAGVPVVAAAQGGMREFVEHEGNGLTFTPRSARSLCATLQRLIDEPELLGRLRAQIRASGSVKEIGENARELEALYATLPRD